MYRYKWLSTKTVKYKNVFIACIYVLATGLILHIEHDHILLHESKVFSLYSKQTAQMHNIKPREQIYKNFVPSNSYLQPCSGLPHPIQRHPSLRFAANHESQ